MTLDHDCYLHFTDVPSKGCANNGTVRPEELAPKFTLLPMMPAMITRFLGVLFPGLTWHSSLDQESRKF